MSPLNLTILPVMSNFLEGLYLQTGEYRSVELSQLWLKSGVFRVVLRQRGLHEINELVSEPRFEPIHLSIGSGSTVLYKLAPSLWLNATFTPMDTFLS